MSSPVLVPGERGESPAAPTAAELITALTLPDIARFDTTSAGFLGLPDFAPFADPFDLTAVPRLTKVEAARTVSDDCVAALSALKSLEDATAACKAAVIERLYCATQAEDTALGLDSWQNTLSAMSCRAEIATVLTVSEGQAGGLLEHSATLIRDLPATFTSLRDGAISWGHAVVIADESLTLRSSGIPEAAITAYEQALLGKAGCTLRSFRDKARRLREGTYPESITTRTKVAYEQRRIEVQRVQDGMSWLSLYLPAPTVEGIWDQCTFIAKNAQRPSETRTLTQLRADVAATLLLGQDLAANGINSHQGPHTTENNPPVGDPPQDASHGMDDAFSRLGFITEPWTIEDGSEPGRDYSLNDEQVPTFPKPDYSDLDFPIPDVWDPDSWRPDSWITGTAAPDGGVPGVAWSGLPPMPAVMPVVLIPALSLIGVSNAPALLEGYGPISIDIAKRLLANASCFYRAFTDPLTGEALALTPDTRRVSKKMRTMLQASNEFCTFPGCTVKAAHAELDHLTPWEQGGKTIPDNLEPLDKRHHLLKHFKDDRTRNGHRRENQAPERAAMKLRGWTPTMTDSGRPGWTSPTGRYYPPQPPDIEPPSYPKWLMKKISARINAATTAPLNSRRRQLHAGPADLSPAEGLLADYLSA